MPLSAEIARQGEPDTPMLAMTGELTPRANAELRRLGWTLAGLD